MPADVGGAIYVHLAKMADVSSIEGRLSDFVARTSDPSQSNGHLLHQSKPMLQPTGFAGGRETA